MNRDVVVGFLKISLLGVLAVLLAIRIWQEDEVEQRWLDVRAAHEGYEEKLKGFGDQLASVERAVQGGERVVGSSDVPEREIDPRTLPYWPTEDNILVDLSNEPKPPPDAPRGGIIRYYTGSNPRGLNSHVFNEAELQERICGPVYEYIADQSRNDPDQYVPGLCNRVAVNEDFTVFTCYVRKGMYWQKPFLTPEEKRGRLAWLDKLPREEVTAEDVKFTFDVLKDPLSECSSLASYLEDLEAVEVVDRYVVRVRWKRSLYYNKSSTLGLIFIHPKFIFTRDENGNPLPEDQIAPTYPQHWFNNKMCGTGPFQFAGWEPNLYVRLRRNDDWWNPVKPVIDGVDMAIVNERDKQMALFKAGEIDVVMAQPSDYRAEYLEGRPGSLREKIDKGEVILKKWEAFAYIYVGWNLRHAMFQDKQVRHALAHLFPKDQIISDVYYGLATAHNSPVHSFENQHLKDAGLFPLDHTKAAAILDAAGWKMGPRNVREKILDGKAVELRFKVLYPTGLSAYRDATLLFQKSAEKVGVLIEPEQQDWQVLTKRLEDRDFDACFLGWGNTWDGDPSQIWHGSQVDVPRSSNHVSYRSAELDQAIEGLKTTFDPAARNRLREQFQRIIMEDQPYCFAYVPLRPWFVSARLGNPYFAKLRPQDWFLPWYVKPGK
jgi:peptide/nickel transport system substrate-binding protein